MGIPILSDILDMFKWLLDFFVNKAPRPIQIMFFLMMLVMFAALIPTGLHLFGLHCSSTGEVEKVSIMKVGTNIQLIFADPKDLYNASSFTPEKLGLGFVGETCFRSICWTGTEYRYSFDSQCANKTTLYPFKSRTFSYFACSSCLGDINNTYIASNAGSDNVDLCFGNAYPIPIGDRNFYQSHFCSTDSQCVPPPNYAYNYSTHTYDCVVPNICGAAVVNASHKSVVDEMLFDAGAEALYGSSMKRQDYRNVVMFKCDSNKSVAMTFYGIPIFDYRLWLIALIIGVLFIGLTNLGQQSNIRR